MMKKLNSYPFYEGYLRSRQKTTTLRLESESPFRKGEEVILSVGWDEKNVIDLHRGLIKAVYRRRIRDLKEIDFEGESPDCKSRESATLVLSSIYRTVLNDDAVVWVVKFEHK